ENAHEMFEETQEFGAPRFPRDIVINDTNPHGWPTYANITSVYGPHGVEGGFTPPLVRVPTPWRLKIAWDLSASRSTYRVHEAVADSLSTVVKNVFAHYGAARISELALDLFGGDYEARLMRGSNSKWSTHSWGVAIDYDPAHNKLSWNSSQARFAAPEYEAWWGYWEEEGWVSLGRTQNRDWMHVQAIKL
ncbi:MAG: M15 family metallopeptidase, partial [Rhodobacteraceae bacterium]|nr:M15 family metallopeptidase [Paracoccaceae bacterium]